MEMYNRHTVRLHSIRAHNTANVKMWIKFSNPPKNCNNEPISKFFGVLERSEFALSVQNKCFVYRNPKQFQNTKFVEISCYGSDILVFLWSFDHWISIMDHPAIAISHPQLRTSLLRYPNVSGEIPRLYSSSRMP